MPREKTLPPGVDRRRATSIVLDSDDRPDRAARVRDAADALNLPLAEYVRRALDFVLAGGPELLRRPVDTDEAQDEPEQDVDVPALDRLRAAEDTLRGVKVTGDRYPARWPGDAMTIVVDHVREYWSARNVFVCASDATTGAVLVPAELVHNEIESRARRG